MGQLAVTITRSLVAGAASGPTGNAIFTLQRGSNAGNGDGLGQINFADTRTSSNYAQIFGAVDGTPGTNDFPGRLSFNTAADGASSPSERMRLDSSGNLKIGGTLPSTPNISLNADGSATFKSTNPVVTDQPSNGNIANPAIQIKHDGTINGSWRHDGRLEVGGQDANAEITLSPDGSITNKNFINVRNENSSLGAVYIGNADGNAARNNVAFEISPTLTSNDAKVRLNYDGPMSFGGEINIGGYDGNSTTTDGVLLGSVGGVYSQLAKSATAATGVVFQGMHGSTFTSRITAAGSMMFANDITLDRATAPSDVKISGSDTHAVWLSDGKFVLKYDGSASFDGTITADGYSLANLTQLT